MSRQACSSHQHRISVIVPTLNEEDHLGDLLGSLDAQDHVAAEVIVVDGGSTDGTIGVAEEHGAHVLRLPGLKEWPSANRGSEVAQGEILLFTGADVVLPPRTLREIARAFCRDPRVIAVGGPGVPVDPPMLLAVEFAAYNAARYMAARLPGRLRRFSASTNLLAVRREAFVRAGGLGPDPCNADGLLAARLAGMGKVHFSYRAIRGYMSSRRLRTMGFWEFNKHYAYVFENFFHAAGRSGVVQRLKVQTGREHSKMRTDPSDVATGPGAGDRATRT